MADADDVVKRQKVHHLSGVDAALDAAPPAPTLSQVPLTPPPPAEVGSGSASIEDPELAFARAQTSDQGLIDTITRKDSFSELGLTFDNFRLGLQGRSGPHPEIARIVQSTGEAGISLPMLRKRIQKELGIERTVKGPYLLVYLKHFTSVYRVEGGPLPRDVCVYPVEYEYSA
jgi:hypothetical protein